MPARHLPVRPDLNQLKHQAKDLLRAIRRGDPSAIEDLQTYHPDKVEPAKAKLADAQLVLARSYGGPSWPRLVLACRLIDAIWENDIGEVRSIVVQHPALLHENARVQKDNWGRPMSYAANLGRDEIIEMLHGLGATDLQFALDRATLQSRIDTARKLHAMMGAPRPPAGAFGGAAYTLSASGTALMFEFGAQLVDEHGNPDAPADVVIESDSRNPDAKHKILEMYVEHGFTLPDTPMMALHRGRIDLLEDHLRRDPLLLSRTFPYEEIFPPSLRCHDEQLPRTTLSGATLLHVCVEFDELDIARWLLDRGTNPDAPAAIDAAGFGGHTPLFGAVVCYANFWGNFTGGWTYSGPPTDSPFARLLLDRGANPNARASMRETVMSGDDRTPREHRDITPLAWGAHFHNKMVVSAPAMRLIAERGGHD
ncbi:MAG TPA: ankyrin repeat domain-containing protein [Gemmatimonadaceae bacterium]|nr:ankyrin repeat domain-containing protein [Gemmatimonadaceae bacterium]